MFRGVSAAAALIGSAVGAHAQQSTSLVGSWKLVSASAVSGEGRPIALPFGDSPSGEITYTGDGRVSVLISHGGRKLLSADRIAAPTAEKAEAFATFFAYAGTYSVRRDQVVHHVEISSVPNWVGTDLVRAVKVTGNELTLTTPPITIGGVAQTTVLRWMRTRPR
ncbi:MAG: lipocalin-like domain-containing protein [Sphingomicrobium sp.]|nr:lipocalin-like domain-containing protein [Sphingomonadales bacterium]